MTEAALPAAAQRVQDHLDTLGLPHRVRVMPDSTRTSADAAAAIGCTVAQIAKSVVFRAKDTGAAVLVIASGVNRVDEKKVKALLGAPLGKADADFVRARTGYAIGGVPPVAHAHPPVVFIDRALEDFAEIWAAAGTPRAVFRLTPAELVRITGGTVADVAQ
jgi:prolyl-tRNA editing enzyme YbaK/EbsC (Cys-tRNA(Pro) deacylase)